MKRNYQDPEYTSFRKEVLKRDGSTCKMPGCGSRKNLHVHHIKTWANASSLRYSPSNGITLCKNCHKSITGKEIHYESLFLEIIRDIYDI